MKFAILSFICGPQASHEQKLIYSGQLLGDSVVLKDILRQYDGQDTHTVHLVCSPNQKHGSPSKKPMTQPPTQRDNSTNATETSTTRVPAPSTGEADQRVPPNFQWYNNNGQNDDQYAMQFAMMQQAYMQYMTHYMNL